MPQADINGQKIYYEDTGGSGLPVVLAHGFLMDLEMFAPQVAALAPEFRVITWDERGFGKTEFDGQAFTYWDSARDCLALLDHLGIDRAVVGGMSQGGYLSLRVALTAPERVLGLVLIDTQATPEDPALAGGYQQMIDAWAAIGPTDELAQTIAKIIIDDPQENARWIAKWKSRPHALIREPGNCLLHRDDITPRLPEINCPAMVVHGTADTAISLPRMRIMANALRDCEVVEIEGAAHASNLTHPEPVNAALLPFLRRIAAGSV
ncbi:alpha/beta hydrolase [Sinimarinibacterium sp. CAU 1509]|uniref:alpha/beta fold hydrolase n=1 Tax=Sinimarinibacterium sp. CAU 1509 TaxID=2562283 RepID=UPI0010AD9C1F|nr:alpha/beta hydrolase [Sinimarinibacterium sp. CAU 1509]TJY65015.1 alpha/beta hydrolase [Sinimarinibacterium sp. CAU 1509]